jgi:hypothetical protein
MALQDLTPQLRTRLSRMERAVGWFVFLATALLLFGFGYYIYHTAERKGWFKIKAPFFTLCPKLGRPERRRPGRDDGFSSRRNHALSAMPPRDRTTSKLNFEIRDPIFRYIWTGGSYVKVNAPDFLGKRAARSHARHKRLRDCRHAAGFHFSTG